MLYSDGTLGHEGIERLLPVLSMEALGTLLVSMYLNGS